MDLVYKKKKKLVVDGQPTICMDSMVKDSDDSILDVEKFSVVKVKGGRSGPALHIVVTARGLNVNVVYRFECQYGLGPGCQCGLRV